MWHLHTCAHPHLDLRVVSASSSIELFIELPPKVRYWSVKRIIFHLSGQEIAFITITTITVIVVIITRERSNP